MKLIEDRVRLVCEIAMQNEHERLEGDRRRRGGREGEKEKSRGKN